jgi:colicin import membrane protein
MAAAALAHDALLPRPPGGMAPGAVLALLVHAGLIAALTTAIDWRTETTEVVSAELWASVPRAAAPAPAAPPALPAPPTQAPPATVPAPPHAGPARPEADIAIERAQQRKAAAVRAKADLEARQKAREAAAAEAAAERMRAAAEKKQREQDEREARADEERLARQREDNLKRMMGQAGAATGNTGGTGSTGAAAQGAAPSAAYLGRVAKLIRDQSVFTGKVPGNAATEVEVRTAPGGTIISRRLVKSSGTPEWDDAVLRAIDKAGTLPRDPDGRVPTLLIVAFRPHD